MEKYAQVTSRVGHYYGLEAYLNVWHPNVTSTGEYSTSQVWVSSSGPLVNISTMEVGWTVSFKLAKNDYKYIYKYICITMKIK